MRNPYPYAPEVSIVSTPLLLMGDPFTVAEDIIIRLVTSEYLACEVTSE
jgi:hypothetical protein